MSEFNKNPEGSADITRIEKARTEKTLAQRIESGEINSQFELDDILYREVDGPITSKEIGERGAIVLTQSELEYLGIIRLVRPNGEEMVIDYDDMDFSESDRLIIFPEELGDIETE